MLRCAVAGRVTVKILSGILPFPPARAQPRDPVLLFAPRGTGGVCASGLGRGGLFVLAPLRRNAFVVCLLGSGSLARRFGKIGEAFPAQVLEHLPDDRSRKIEV